jgi:hypothetical protein
MINTQHRWPLPVILGSVVLLLVGTGLFLTGATTSRYAAPVPPELTTDSFDDARRAAAMERLG